MAYLASSACCIASIACLAKQETARTGNALGMVGVGSGIAATMGLLDIPAAAYVQLAGGLGLGGGLVGWIGWRMGG